LRVNPRRAVERERQPWQRHLGELLREDEQAEHDEERDLGEEREALVEGDELAAVPGGSTADGEADEVDREEAAAADHVRRAERERTGRDRRHGGESADRVGKTCEYPRREGAEHGPDDQPEAQLLDDEEREVVEAVRVRPLDPRDQAEGERYGHRVVAAGLRLERAGERPPDVGEAERREDGCGVGGSDDCSEQGRLEPRQVEEPVCGGAREQCADGDTDGTEQCRGNGHLAKPPPRRL
jgi:hypothetical protein